MARRDITLLVIEAAPDGGLSPVQIQKSLFLVAMSGVAGLPSDFYEFRPYDYGPFCEEVYQDTDALVNEGLVFQIPVLGQTWAKYAISPRGQREAEDIKGHVHYGLSAYVREIVEWVSSLTFSELLRTIYARYPDYSVNSVFQE